MSETAPLALVVGGSGDIGRAIATRLGQLKYRMAITGLTEERIEEALRELSSSGVEASGFLCDLNDETSIATLFEEIGAASSNLEVLVNAAGVGGHRRLMKASQSHFEEILRVNLVGAALVAGHGLRFMRKARSGTIVNITSMGGVEGREGFGAYCASKGGLIALTDSLREEAARYGIRVASVCPDQVDTKMHGDDEERLKMIHPDDVAEAVVFLLRLSPTAVVREIRIFTGEA